MKPSPKRHPSEHWTTTRSTLRGLPPGVCEDCRAKAIHESTSGIIAVYCTHSWTMAHRHELALVWTALCPVFEGSRDLFEDAVKSSLSEALQRQLKQATDRH